MEEVDGPVVTDTAHVVVAVLVLPRTLAPVAFLETRDENFEVIGILDAQSLDHLRAEAGDRHGPVEDVGLPSFAGDHNLFDVLAAATVAFGVGVGLVRRVGWQPDQGQSQTQRRGRCKNLQSLHGFSPLRRSPIARFPWYGFTEFGV